MDFSAQEVLAAFQRYKAADLSVAPILTDGSKSPAVPWKPFQSRIAGDDELQQWAAAGYGIAIVCGAVSGNLEVIDNDEAALFPEYCELVESHAPGLFERLIHIQTPSGGNHLALRSAEIGGNQKLALRAVQDGGKQKLKVLFEIRGEGGYIVAPGSPLAVHPTGEPYRLIQGDFDHILTVTPAERDLLFGLARSFNEMPPEEKPRPAARKQTGGAPRPGDDFNERGDVEVVLFSHGWAVSRRRGPVVFLRKPGKQGRGHQATLNAVAPGVFYCFSTSAAPFEDRKGYSAFQVYALLEHGGDYTAAARALSKQGYGRRKKIKANLSPISKPENTVKLEKPKRPTNTVQLPKPVRPINTVQLPKPARPAMTIILNAEAAR